MVGEKGRCEYIKSGSGKLMRVSMISRSCLSCLSQEVTTTVIRLSTVSFTATIPARDELHQQTVSGVIGIDVGPTLVRLQEAA